MSDEFNESDRERFNALFAEQMRWASMSVTIEEIAQANKLLVRDLAKYAPLATVSLLASLLTVPEYQSNCIRLEILVALAVVHCHGRKKASISCQAPYDNIPRRSWPLFWARERISDILLKHEQPDLSS